MKTIKIYKLGKIQILSIISFEFKIIKFVHLKTKNQLVYLNKQ